MRFKQKRWKLSCCIFISVFCRTHTKLPTINQSLARCWLCTSPNLAVVIYINKTCHALGVGAPQQLTQIAGERANTRGTDQGLETEEGKEEKRIMSGFSFHFFWSDSFRDWLMIDFFFRLFLLIWLMIDFFFRLYSLLTLTENLYAVLLWKGYGIYTMAPLTLWMKLI